MSNRQQPPLIESMESRVLFDASQLSETIVASTLPTAVSDQAVLKATVSVEVANDSGAAQKFRAALGIYVADQVLNLSSGNGTLLRSANQNISLASGQNKLFKVPISVPAGKLSDGTDTLFSMLTDQTSAHSQSPAGPTLLVHPPYVSLAETETFLRLPASTAVGATLKAVDKIHITNNGSDPFTGSLTIALLAAPNDTVTGSTTVTSLVRKLTIPAGHSANVNLNFRSEAPLSPGAYQLLSAVTQPNGTVTSSNPATAPTFTIIAPATAPAFVPSITSANELYATDANDSSAQHITSLDLAMSIVNNGTNSIGADTFTLFASTKSTLDSSAIQESSLPLTLDEYTGSNTPFQIDFSIPDNGPDNGTAVNYYIFVKITDTSGGTSVASYASPISFAGPIG
jgi:hypothetical protein